MCVRVPGEEGWVEQAGRPDGCPSGLLTRETRAEGDAPIPWWRVAGPLGQNPCRRRGLRELDTGPCGARWAGTAQEGSRATAACVPTLPLGVSSAPPACAPKSSGVDHTSQHSSALSPFLSLFLFLLLSPLFPGIHFSLLFPSFSVYFFFLLRFLSSVFFLFTPFPTSF